MMGASATGSEMYLDHAATTPLRQVAAEAMAAFSLASHGNASGQHTAARRAKNALEEARESAADLIGAGSPHDIVFTSGGTESDNLAVIGATSKSTRHRVVVSAVEHKAVLEAAAVLRRRGVEVGVIAVDRRGAIDNASLEACLEIPTALASIQTANNETGVVQPIQHLVEQIRAFDSDVIVHCDAAQSFISDGLDVGSLGVDLASLSAHKFGGPTGVGLLYIAPGTHLEPLLVGGGQEAGLRSGTSNVAGILGMVAAMEEATAASTEFSRRIEAERDDFETLLRHRSRDISITCSDEKRLPHFSHFLVPSIDAETLLIRLDRVGLFASVGSACQSGALEPSHVLLAMGFNDSLARHCIRVTFGWDSEPGLGSNAAAVILEVLGDMQ
ncbi:MAG: aminotransferase class V-fold PLP-dependent enzyme [Proteobacteria bacterium]|nr:aminotransferase class V-fold PLP-dependent enzyme [Pseudomonadota bacterium]